MFAKETKLANHFTALQQDANLLHQLPQTANRLSCSECAAFSLCTQSKTREQLEDVQRQVYPAKTALFTQGGRAAGAFVVCKGSVKLSLTSKTGKTAILRVARAGEIVGITSLLSGNPYRASAETLEATEACFLGRIPFLEYLSNNPAAALKIAQQSTANYQNACKRIMLLGLCHSVPERLAHFLLSWSRSKASIPGNVVPLRLTHAEIAHIIGTSRETVTRTLVAFKKNGWARLHAFTLVISNPQALRELAAACETEEYEESSAPPNTIAASARTSN